MLFGATVRLASIPHNLLRTPALVEPIEFSRGFLAEFRPIEPLDSTRGFQLRRSISKAVKTHGRDLGGRPKQHLNIKPTKPGANHPIPRPN